MFVLLICFSPYLKGRPFNPPRGVLWPKVGNGVENEFAGPSGPRVQKVNTRVEKESKNWKELTSLILSFWAGRPRNSFSTPFPTLGPKGPRTPLGGLKGRSLIWKAEKGEKDKSEIFRKFSWKSRKSLESPIGAGQVGSYANGVGWIQPDFNRFSPVGVRLVPLKTHDFKGFCPDLNRILTGL